MRFNALLLIVTLAATAFVSQAAEPTEPVLPKQMPTLLPISTLPASYPKDVPVPPQGKPVAAADREIGLIIVFMATGKSEAMRSFYETELVKQGFRIDGADRLGPEQGIFATKGERTLSIFFEERGDDLQVQVAHVPRPPGKP